MEQALNRMRKREEKRIRQLERRIDKAERRAAVTKQWSWEQPYRVAYGPFRRTGRAGKGGKGLTYEYRTRSGGSAHIPLWALAGAPSEGYFNAHPEMFRDEANKIIAARKAKAEELRQRASERAEWVGTHGGKYVANKRRRRGRHISARGRRKLRRLARSRRRTRSGRFTRKGARKSRKRSRRSSRRWSRSSKRSSKRSRRSSRRWARSSKRSRRSSRRRSRSSRRSRRSARGWSKRSRRHARSHRGHRRGRRYKRNASVGEVTGAFGMAVPFVVGLVAHRALVLGVGKIVDVGSSPVAALLTSFGVAILGSLGAVALSQQYGKPLAAGMAGSALLDLGYVGYAQAMHGLGTAGIPMVNTTGYRGLGYPGEQRLMQAYGYPGERGLMQQYSGQPYTQSSAAYGVLPYSQAAAGMGSYEPVAGLSSYEPVNGMGSYEPVNGVGSYEPVNGFGGPNLYPQQAAAGFGVLPYSQAAAGLGYGPSSVEYGDTVHEGIDPSNPGAIEAALNAADMNNLYPQQAAAGMGAIPSQGQWIPPTVQNFPV